MATLSLQAPAGGPHCAVYSFVRPPGANRVGRVVVTSNINTVNNPANDRNFFVGGVPSIEFDIRSAASLHNALYGRLVNLNLRNGYFNRYTVLLQQYNPQDNPLTSDPIRVHEFIVPAAHPGPIRDSPGTLNACVILEDAAHYGWALQVRGLTKHGQTKRELAQEDGTVI